MKKAIAGLAVGVALVAVPVLAQTEDSNKDQDALVCKREKKPNSRFTTKTCHTRGEWNEIAETNKRNYAEQRDRPVIDIRPPQ